MTTNNEERLAQRRRLEAAARWNEQQAYLARKRDNERDATRYHNNMMRARLAQR